MSYNGSGVFTINTAGQPVVTGTTISSTTFNNLTADLATGLTTALTKDGQSTPTANIGMGAFKITNLAAGTVASDAARLDQVQGGSATFITAAGTDTITGTTSPALTAYATGNQFSFLVANTNTGAVTINVDGLGAKAITRTGTTALIAGDMIAGQAVEIIYDGTRFQLVNGNSFTNLKVSGTLGVTGVSTFTAQPIVSSLTASLPIFTDGSKGLVSNTMTGTGSVVMSISPSLTTPALGTPASGLMTNVTGTASGLTAGNVTTNANLTGPITSVGNATSIASQTGTGTTFAMSASPTFTGTVGAVDVTTTGNTILGDATTDTLNVGAGGLVKDASGNVGIGTASPSYPLDVQNAVTTGVGTVIGAYNTASSGSSIATLRIRTAGTGAGYWDINTGNTSSGLNSGIRFFDNIAGTERMRIDSSGNLLVGTTSQLGSAMFTMVFSGASLKGACFRDTKTTAGSDDMFLFQRGATQVGSINTTLSTTAYNTSSDYRLKNTIAPMTGALDKVALLKPVTYKWNVDGSDGQGFIAHELQAVVPDAVVGEKDALKEDGNPDYQGIDTSFLVATLTAAIQELKAIVDAQAVRIAALES